MGGLSAASPLLRISHCSPQLRSAATLASTMMNSPHCGVGWDECGSFPDSSPCRASLLSTDLRAHDWFIEHPKTRRGAVDTACNRSGFGRPYERLRSSFGATRSLGITPLRICTRQVCFDTATSNSVALRLRRSVWPIGLPHRRIVSLETDDGMMVNLGILATLANERRPNRRAAPTLAAAAARAAVDRACARHCQLADCRRSFPSSNGDTNTPVVMIASVPPISFSGRSAAAGKRIDSMSAIELILPACFVPAIRRVPGAAPTGTTERRRR